MQHHFTESENWLSRLVSLILLNELTKLICNSWDEKRVAAFLFFLCRSLYFFTHSGVLRFPSLLACGNTRNIHLLKGSTEYTTILNAKHLAKTLALLNSTKHHFILLYSVSKGRQLLFIYLFSKLCSNSRQYFYADYFVICWVFSESSFDILTYKL